MKVPCNFITFQGGCKIIFFTIISYIGLGLVPGYISSQALLCGKCVTLKIVLVATQGSFILFRFSIRDLKEKTAFGVLGAMLVS